MGPEHCCAFEKVVFACGCQLHLIRSLNSLCKLDQVFNCALLKSAVSHLIVKHFVYAFGGISTAMGVGKLALLATVYSLLISYALWTFYWTPTPQPADTPASQFSEARARHHVSVLTEQIGVRSVSDQQSVSSWWPPQIEFSLQ